MIYFELENIFYFFVSEKSSVYFKKEYIYYLTYLFRINLIKEKDILATQGKYLEAENIRKKINDIKNNTIIQNKRELENRQFNEMKQLEENFNAEVKSINDYWENEFVNFENHYSGLFNNMDEKHKKELLNLKEYIEDKFNKNFKFSKEYLDLKKSEINLVKLER